MSQFQGGVCLSVEEVRRIAQSQGKLSLHTVHCVLRELEIALACKARKTLGDNFPYLSAFTTQAVMIAQRILRENFFKVFSFLEVKPFLSEAAKEVYHQCVGKFPMQSLHALFVGPSSVHTYDLVQIGMWEYCEVVDLSQSSEASQFTVQSIARLHMQSLQQQIASICLAQVRTGFRAPDSPACHAYVYWVAVHQRPIALPDPGWGIEYRPEFATVQYDNALIQALFDLYATVTGLRDVVQRNNPCLVADPLVMVWFRNVLKYVYVYPAESSINESQFLTAMNGVAAQTLKSLGLRKSILKDCDGQCEISSLTGFLSVGTILFFPGTYTDHNLIQRHNTESKLFSASIDVFAWNLPKRLQKWSILPFEIVKNLISGDALQSVVNRSATPRAVLIQAAKEIPKAVSSALSESITELNEGIILASTAFISLLESHHFSNHYVSCICSDFSAEVVLTALESLSLRNSSSPDPLYLDSVLFLVPLTRLKHVQWNAVRSAVRGRVVIAYFSNAVHRGVTRLMELEAWEVVTTCEGVDSYDVSDLLTAGFRNILVKSPINDQMVAEIVERTGFYP